MGYLSCERVVEGADPYGRICFAHREIEQKSCGGSEPPPYKCFICFAINAFFPYVSGGASPSPTHKDMCFAFK